MLARACFLVAMVSLSGCFLLKRDLPDLVYEPDAWTVRVASSCGERATLRETLRFTELSFNINRTEGACLAIEAGRLFEEAAPTAYRVQLHGSPVAYVSVNCDDDSNEGYQSAVIGPSPSALARTTAASRPGRGARHLALT